MSVTVTDVEVRVWKQQADHVFADRLGEGIYGEGIYGEEVRPEPDLELGAAELRSIQIDERADDYMDEASLDLNHPNAGSGHTFGYNLEVGDMIEVWVDLGGDAPAPSSLGEGPLGLSPLGGGPTALDAVTWLGRIQPREHGRDDMGRHGGHITADAADWVGSVLSDKEITKPWVGEAVDDIIRDIVVERAPDIDDSAIPDLGAQTDLFANQRNCWDLVNSLAARGDALIHQDGRRLLADPIDSLPYRFELTPQDYLLPIDVSTDDDIHNTVRVDAGTSRQREQDNELEPGTDPATLELVTDEDRVTYRLRARKSAIHRVELWVARAEDSDDDIRVRLQADEDGAPVAINDQDSDIVAGSWSGEDLPGGGWQDIFFDDHVLPDRDPWLIVESEGMDGQFVGVDDGGTPHFRSYYPHPVNYQDSNPASIERYGEREKSVEKDNLDTLVAVRDAVLEELARGAYPTETVQFVADSARAHALMTGDVIEIDMPGEDLSGRYIVIEVSRTIDAETVQLETQITVMSREGVLAEIAR